MVDVGYIDQTYYQNTYVGTDIPSTDFPRLEARASDMIDELTRYQIDDLSTLDAFTQKQVKKAVASQVEYLFTRGGEEANHGSGNVTSANIGHFSYDDGNGANENLSREAIRTSPAVIGLLKPTGLLYTGVNANATYTV